MSPKNRHIHNQCTQYRANISKFRINLERLIMSTIHAQRIGSPVLLDGQPQLVVRFDGVVQASPARRTPNFLPAGVGVCNAGPLGVEGRGNCGLDGNVCVAV